MSERFLLVVESVKDGARMLRAFGADPAEWHVTYFGAPLLGWRFARAVVFLPQDGRAAAIGFTREVVRGRLPSDVLPEIF